MPAKKTAVHVSTTRSTCLAHTASGGISDSGVAMLFGGGVDFGKRKLVFRAVQFDWMVLRFSGITDKNNMRVNTGILYRF